MSGCYYGPFISDDQPVNCPYEMYERDDWGSVLPPIITVVRNSATVDVTGTVTDLGTGPLVVDIYTVDCDGVPFAHTTSSEPYHHWSFTVSGANEGEMLSVNGQLHGQVKPAGTCATTALDPNPECSGMYDWSMCEGYGSDTVTPPGDDDTGCNASGATGLVCALFTFALIVRRRNKHAR